MKLPHKLKKTRTGFTLIEVMVVVVIIAVLVGLLVATVSKALGKGKQVRNLENISQIAVALENFKSRYKFYPPSQIVLCEDYNSYFVGGNPANGPLSPLHADSLAVINAMWTRINWANGIDWNGDNVVPSPPVTLEGDQCLVFFLGGIPDNRNPGSLPSCTGFSTNAANPAWHIKNGGDATPPFFEFESTRLGFLPIPAGYPTFTWPRPVRSTSHYSYADTYGSKPGDFAPYAYFSSYKTRNGYNRYYDPKNYPYSDCLLLSMPAPAGFGNPQAGGGLWPYAQSVPPSSTTTQYLKPDTFQIISAGMDHIFGFGTDPTKAPLVLTWTPASASAAYPTGNPGNDDQSNFYDTLLGQETK